MRWGRRSIKSRWVWCGLTRWKESFSPSNENYYTACFYCRLPQKNTSLSTHLQYIAWPEPHWINLVDWSIVEWSIVKSILRAKNKSKIDLSAFISHCCIWRQTVIVYSKYFHSTMVYLLFWSRVNKRCAQPKRHVNSVTLFIVTIHASIANKKTLEWYKFSF